MVWSLLIKMKLFDALDDGVKRGIVEPPLRIHPGASINEQLLAADRNPTGSYELSLITQVPQRGGTAYDGSMFFYGVKDARKFEELINDQNVLGK